MPYLLDKPGIEFKHRPLLFIDMEFTGLDVSRHEIVEIAALAVSQPDFSVTSSYYTKVFPTDITSADPKALKLINYSQASWSDATPLRQALIELSALAPDCLLAGWAVQNEWDFLNAALEKENLPYFYDHRLIEIYSLAFARFYKDPQMTHLNLKNTANILGVYIDRHKPDSDIRATYEIFKHLIDQNPA